MIPVPVWPRRAPALRPTSPLGTRALPGRRAAGQCSEDSNASTLSADWRSANAAPSSPWSPTPRVAEQSARCPPPRCGRPPPGSGNHGSGPPTSDGRDAADSRLGTVPIPTAPPRGAATAVATPAWARLVAWAGIPAAASGTPAMTHHTHTGTTRGPTATAPPVDGVPADLFEINHDCPRVGDG